MDYLQYLKKEHLEKYLSDGFKPCYKWITFNTEDIKFILTQPFCFKPCYKWITFNTIKQLIFFIYIFI